MEYREKECREDRGKKRRIAHTWVPLLRHLALRVKAVIIAETINSGRTRL